MIEKILLPDRFESTGLKIGVTGGIGSGKSLFCSIIESFGFPALNADNIAKELMHNNEVIRAFLIEKFGDESYRDGLLHIKYLSNTVFNNPQKLALLNSIVHPFVIKHSILKMNEKLLPKSFVFYESALIFEAGMQNLFDLIIVIISGEAERVQRILKRSSLEEADIRLRIRSQMKDYADHVEWGFIINNDGNELALREDAREVIECLQLRIS